MLHSLVIKNFRCLEDFTVEKLGRVNLIVGKNNSGKSTVLEALRIYAGKANQELLDEIAVSHNETRLLNYKDIGKSNMPFPFQELFTNRHFPKEKKILIGESQTDEKTVFIKPVFYINKTIEHPLFGQITRQEIISNTNIETEIISDRQALWVHNYNQKFQFLISFDYSMPPAQISPDFLIKTSIIPTEFISIDELASDWDKIVYTEYESIVINALKIINPDFEHLVFVQSENATTLNRIAKVKLSNHPRPVPLKSLGDGMTRILQLALKLVSAQSGFLLIDEFENGLHYSTQEKIWSWLFEVAEQLDIQVFATTHSWDCIESFATVANEKENIEAVLFRMGRSAKKSNQGQIIATVFDKEKLFNVTQADIEIR